MTAPKQPPVVAELGRPETPQETAERKALSSRRHRERQTLVNLVGALLASLVAVLILVLVVVRPEPPAPAPIDYRAIAAEAGTEVPLAAPDLPSGWNANAATFEAQPSDGVVNWYIGFVTPDQQFVALRQGIGANPTWVANQLSGARSTGETTIAGVTWTIYDHRTAKDAGNLAYAMTAQNQASSFILFGTAVDSEFETVAAALAPTISERK
ncbi:MAG TPA: DUF4245 domain-containing protein [Terrimesophilobacter sp.]|jgi:hypothetical protein|uniref:DUF4245 domain-containing protein n=1 Tax=Terrimesophilobacter sp. TaxID=2906435 RepID=UPI002F95E6D5